MLRNVRSRVLLGLHRPRSLGEVRPRGGIGAELKGTALAQVELWGLEELK